MFEPTLKQLDALARMETYIDVMNPRTLFDDKKSFEDYWKFISNKCDQKTKLRKAISDGKTSHAKINKRRQNNKLEHYNDKDTLLRYAKKYQKRYHPSTEKLRQQLILKSNNPELSTQVVAEFNDIINDDALALMRAEAMRAKGKNVQHIKQKLALRGFSKETIGRCIQAMQDEQGSIWEQDALHKKITQLKRKGLSLQAIRQQCCDTNADAEIVEDMLATVFGNVSDNENLQRLIDKLQRKNLDHDKMIRQLMSKGFRYDDIKRTLDQQNLEA